MEVRVFSTAPNSPEKLPFEGHTPGYPPNVAQFRAISRGLKMRLQPETPRLRATSRRKQAAVSGAKILTAVEMLEIDSGEAEQCALVGPSERQVDVLQGARSQLTGPH